MTGPQRFIFVTGVLGLIAIGSTVIVLSAERLFPAARYLSLAGPLFCFVLVVVFMRRRRS